MAADGARERSAFSHSLWIGLLLAILCSACAKVRFTEQRIYVQHDAERDLAEVLLVYQGLYPSRSKTAFIGAPYVNAPGSEVTEGEERPYTDDQIEDGAEAAIWIDTGRRYFILGFWAFEIDLDGPGARDSEDEEERSELEEFVNDISISASGLYLNEEGRLCAYQVLRIPRVSLGLRLLNEGLHAAILAEEDDWRAPAGPVLDERTCELWIQEAKEGVPWVMAHDGGLRVRIPATPRTAARMLESMLTELDGEDGPRSAAPLAAWASCLSGIEVADEHLTLDYRSGKEGRPTWVSTYPEAVYSDEIVKELQEQGWVGRRLTEEEVLKEAW